MSQLFSLNNCLTTFWAEVLRKFVHIKTKEKMAILVFKENVLIDRSK